jgi:hypothetical protein
VPHIGSVQQVLLKHVCVPAMHVKLMVPPHPLGRPLSPQLAGGVGVQLQVPAVLLLEPTQGLFRKGEADAQLQVRFMLPGPLGKALLATVEQGLPTAPLAP